MRYCVPLLIVLALAASCQGPAGSIFGDNPYEPVQAATDTIVPRHLSWALWDTLAICSHPWINADDYDHESKRWIHKDKPDTVSFSFANSAYPFFGKMEQSAGQNRWALTMDKSVLSIHTKEITNFLITSNGGEMFFLFNGGLTKCFSTVDNVDTTRVYVLETTDQLDDPVATLSDNPEHLENQE